MPRTIKNWTDIANSMTLGQLAQFVLSDLTGYRSTSLHRADDTDALMNLFEALEKRIKDAYEG